MCIKTLVHADWDKNHNRKIRIDKWEKEVKEHYRFNPICNDKALRDPVWCYRISVEESENGR